MDISNEKFPGKDIPKGDPSYKLPEERWTFDVSRAEKELNLGGWISLEQSVTDLLTQLYELQGNVLWIISIVQCRRCFLLLFVVECKSRYIIALLEKCVTLRQIALVIHVSLS